MKAEELKDRESFLTILNLLVMVALLYNWNVSWTDCRKDVIKGLVKLQIYPRIQPQQNLRQQSVIF